MVLILTPVVAFPGIILFYLTPLSRYKYDDENVYEVQEEEAIDFNYGRGEINSGCSSAYMLLYIRADATNDMMAPVSSDDIPSSPLPTDMEIEEEVGVLLSKRKRVEEDKAERKAKRIYEQLQREGLELDEVIDAVAKDHGEMHEKATVIRLGFEDEREKFISQVREAGAYTHEELPFDYGFDEAEDSDDMNVAISTRETEQSVTLEGLKDTVVQAVSTAAASPPTRKKVRFVSPIKVSPAKPSEP